MGRRIKKPELCVDRRCTNERPIVDLFADAFRIYFEERESMKSSGRTFDIKEIAEYNGNKNECKEDRNDGSAA